MSIQHESLFCPFQRNVPQAVTHSVILCRAKGRCRPIGSMESVILEPKTRHLPLHPYSHSNVQQATVFGPTLRRSRPQHRRPE